MTSTAPAATRWACGVAQRRRSRLRAFRRCRPVRQSVLDVDNGNVDGGSKVGFSLQTATSSDVLQFYYLGGSVVNEYKYWDSTGEHGTGIPWQNTGLRIEFALTCGNAYVLTVTPCGGSASTFTGTCAGTMAQLKLFNATPATVTGRIATSTTSSSAAILTMRTITPRRLGEPG